MRKLLSLLVIFLLLFTYALPAYAVDLDDGSEGSTETVETVADETPPSISVNPSGQEFTDSLLIEISSDEENTSIYYTLDGSEPTTESLVYNEAFIIDETATLKTFGVDSANNASAVITEDYTLEVPPAEPEESNEESSVDETAPIVSGNPVGQNFTGSLTIELLSNEENTSIYYTLDGEEPTTDSPLYTEPFTIEASTTVKAFGVDVSENASDLLVEEYILDAPEVAPEPEKTTVAMEMPAEEPPEIIDDPLIIEEFPEKFSDIDFGEPKTANEDLIESAGCCRHRPEARNIAILGDPHVGVTLEAYYEFYDRDGDAEHSMGSHIAWYVDGWLVKSGFSNTSGVKTLEITESMVGEDIHLVVKPLSSKWPWWGRCVYTKTTILPPDFMITVDDGYDLYMNGSHEGSDPSDWATIDYYYFDRGMPDPVVIAVHGFDTNGSANIAGFTAATYPKGEVRPSTNHEIITDGSWYKYFGEEPPVDNYNENSWMDPDYKGIPGEWTLATEIPEGHIDSEWPTRVQELTDAKWIWSEHYRVEQADPFHSPVYFRNTLDFLSPPSVDNVRIVEYREGNAEMEGVIHSEYRLGQTLEGVYHYDDPDGEPEAEGGSLYQWYLDGVAIPGATDKIYTLDYNEDSEVNVLEGEITFEVTPVSVAAPTTGEAESSKPVTVEKPNFWISAFNSYDLYINGEFIGSDNDPSAVDYYYLKYYDPDDMVIAVVGNKPIQTRGATSAMTSAFGFIAAYEYEPSPPVDTSVAHSTEWFITNSDWFTNTNDPPAYYPPNDTHWYDVDYLGDDWHAAYEIDLPQAPFPSTHQYLNDSGAKWIWTENYHSPILREAVISIGPDTPVYFRTEIEPLPVYDEEASILSVTEDNLWYLEPTEARVELFDTEGDPLYPVDPANDYSVEFFLDETSVGFGTFDIPNLWYDLIFTPAAPGVYTLSAEVNGEQVPNTIPIAVSKEPLIPEGDLSVNLDLVYEGDDVIATVDLDDQYGEPATSQKVTIYDDGDSMVTTESEPGIYTVTFTPAVGMNEITASVENFPSVTFEPVYVHVINVIETLEHGRSDTGTTSLDPDNTPYNDLALMAQLTTLVPEIGMLRSDIIERALVGALNGEPTVNYRVDNFYSGVENSYSVPALARVEDPGYPLNYLASETGVIKNTSGKIIGVVGHELIPTYDAKTADNGESYYEVEYHENIDNPVVLAHLGSYNGLNDIHARVIEVNPVYEDLVKPSETRDTHATSFGVILESNNYMNSYREEYLPSPGFEVISYLVIEEGVHQVGGVIVEAEKVSGYFSNTTHEFSDHYYMPSVFSQTQTYINIKPRWMRENNITSNTVDLTLQRAPYEYEEPVYDQGVEPMAIQEYEEEVAVVLVADNLAHEVTFTNTYASTFDPQMVEHGTTATNPGTPSRSGYSFTGWTLEGSNFNISTDVVLEDIELVATWSSTGGGGGGGGGTTTTATINAVNDSLVTSENTPVSVSTTELMANDTDADDFESVQNPINGSVSLSGNTVTFTPATDFVGTAYFSYTISDGGDEDNGLVIVTVEELVEINPFETPLGGDPDALILINPEETPLGVIDYSLPYVIGYPDESFKPNREITRGEMAAIFARILFLDTSNPGDPIYTDVKPDDWYYKYVQTVSRMGIFGGYEGNMFKPNRPITHAEIAAAFSEYWDIKGIEISDAGGTYSDVEGHWAEDAINRFFNAGISVGFIDGTFKPNAFTTRAELVVMVNRTLNRPELVDGEPSFPDVQPNFWGFGAIEAASKRYQGESAIKE